MDNSDSDTEVFDNWGSLFIGVVEDDENSPSEKSRSVNQTLLPFKIDPGAQANNVPGNRFRTLKSKSKLHKPNAKLTAYNGSRIPVKGSCILNIELKRKPYPFCL